MNVATERLLAIGGDLALRSSVVLLLGLVVQIVAGRRRAAIGAAAGNACVLGLLLLPLSLVGLPRISLAWLPAATTPKPLAGPMPAPEPAVVMPIERPLSTVREVALPPYRTLPATTPLPQPPMEMSGTERVEPPARRVDWPMLGIVGYAALASAMLVRLLASMIAVERLRRSGIPVEDRGWLDAMERAQAMLGIRRHVGLCWSSRVGIPVVLGWFRPTIVLPLTLAEIDPEEHAGPILIHELAHVKRGDYPWNIALRLAQALYWPNPLAWLLGHMNAELREQVCDDVCVHALGDPSPYGETLVAVASGLSRRPGPALGIAMARRSRLVRRLSRIATSRGASRCVPRPIARTLIAATAIVATAAIGGAQLTRAQVQAPADQPATPAKGAGRVFHLQVVADDTGKPVPNADVRLWITLGDEFRKTDAEGRMEIVHSTGPADRWFGVDVWGEGRAMQRHNYGQDPNKPIPDGDVIRLQPGETLGGIIQDEQGRPIVGAEVYLWSHNYKRKDPHELLYDLRAISGPDGKWQTSGAPETTGELLGFHVIHPDFLSSRDYTTKEHMPKIAELRTGKAVTVMKKGVPIEGRVLDASGHPVVGAMVLSAAYKPELYTNVFRFAVTTDENGHFRTGQVKEGEWFLLVRAKGHAPGTSSVKIGKAIPQVEIALGKPRPFFGRVVEPSGKPIEGAFVNIDSWRGYRFLGVYLYSDADGRFRWDDGPDDRLMINVSCKGYSGEIMKPVQPSDEGISLTMTPSLNIRGTVRDAENNQKIARGQIEYGAADPKTGEVAKWNRMPATGVGVMIYNGDLNVNIPVEADAYRIRLTSDGYAPFVSRVFRRSEKVITGYDVNLVPGRPAGPTATVLRPDGKPLVGARVYSTRLNEGLNVEDGVVKSQSGGNRELLTGTDGSFPIPQEDKSFVVLILGEDCWAYASKKALAEAPRVQAKPYGRVEGRYLIGTRAVPNQSLVLNGLLQDDSTMHCDINYVQTATTDANGRFVFEKVMAIPHLRVAAVADGPKDPVWTLGEPAHVVPGETIQVTLGGKGRAVIGRLEAPEGWTQPIAFTEQAGALIETNQPYIPYPPELFRGKPGLRELHSFEWWSQQWRKSPEGIAHEDRRFSALVLLAPDGSFRIDDVPAGNYRISIHVGEEPIQGKRGPFARLNREFTIPPMPGGRSDEPFDLSSLRLKVRTVPKAGEPAPEFAVTTVDGKPIALKDFRGKYVLLDFGVLWDDQSRFQISRLNDVWKRFGDDERFNILSLVMAPDDAKTRAFIAAKGEPWPQAIVGPLTNPIALSYGIEDRQRGGNLHGAILIGPDGKIVARDLWYRKIIEAIGQALGRPAK